MPFRTQDPFTGKELASYDYSTEIQVLDAIATLSVSGGKWRGLSPRARQERLLVVAERLGQQTEKLARLISSEMGKPFHEAQAEIIKCKITIERACRAELDFLAPRLTENSEIKHEPLGVIYSIMPWNYPFWQAIRMVMPALLAGNTILLKHSELTPLSALALEGVFAGLFDTPVLLNLFIPHDLTDFILSREEVGGVSLTGSVQAGRIVSKVAAEYFKKVVLELGGSDPYIVCADADLKLAAAKIAKGRLLNCGQSCISAKRAIVSRDVLAEFLELLKSEFDQYQFGHDLGPLANTRFKTALAKQVQELQLNTGAKQIYFKPNLQSPNSAFVDAEIYLLNENSQWLRNQEFFGPILLVIAFDSIAEAIEIANSTEFGLGGGVFSQNLPAAKKLAAGIAAGQVAINEIISTDLSRPFGGVKSSGMGRELGIESYFEFTQTKVMITL